MVVHFGLCSRRRMRRRPNTTAALLVAMKKWLHFVRHIALQPPGAAHASAEDIGDIASAAANVDEPTTQGVGKKRFKFLKRMRKDPPAHSEFRKNRDWGVYGPRQRLNVDQVPFNLAHMPRKTFLDPGDASTQIVIESPGSDKRFGTAQICLHGGPGAQPALTLWFRGRGLVLERENHRTTRRCTSNSRTERGQICQLLPRGRTQCSDRSCTRI